MHRSIGVRCWLVVLLIGLCQLAATAAVSITSPSRNTDKHFLVGAPGTVQISGTATGPVSYALSSATVAAGVASGGSSWNFTTPLLSPGNHHLR